MGAATACSKMSVLPWRRSTLRARPSADDSTVILMHDRSSFYLDGSISLQAYVCGPWWSNDGTRVPDLGWLTSMHEPSTCPCRSQTCLWDWGLPCRLLEHIQHRRQLILCSGSLFHRLRTDIAHSAACSHLLATNATGLGQKHWSMPDPASLVEDDCSDEEDKGSQVGYDEITSTLSATWDRYGPRPSACGTKMLTC